jgi:hypothetical protein
MSRTTLNLDGLTKMRAKLKTAIRTAVYETAEIIREDAKARAPRDTEALAESIYVTTTASSDYNQCRSNAESKFNSARSSGKTPKGRRIGPNETLDMIEETRPEDPDEAWVICGVAYGNNIENSATNPQPFITPAVMDNKRTLTDKIRKAMDGLSVKGKITRR